MLKKISDEIALRQVDLVEMIKDVKTLLEKIHKMFTKLCDASLFTEETQHSIMRLQAEIKALGIAMKTTKGDTWLHFS